MVGVKTLLVVVALVGCTPGMHRGYRATMAVLGATAMTMDTRQTIYAIHSGAAPEANPLYGPHPSDAALIAGGVTGVGFMFGFRELIERLPDKGPGTDLVKDILVTVPTVLEACVVYSNTSRVGWRDW